MERCAPPSSALTPVALPAVVAQKSKEAEGVVRRRSLEVAPCTSHMSCKARFLLRVVFVVTRQRTSERERNRQRQTETERERQRQKETDRDRAQTQPALTSASRGSDWDGEIGEHSSPQSGRSCRSLSVQSAKPRRRTWCKMGPESLDSSARSV